MSLNFLKSYFPPSSVYWVMHGSTTCSSIMYVSSASEMYMRLCMIIIYLIFVDKLTLLLSYLMVYHFSAMHMITLEYIEITVLYLKISRN